MLRQGLIFWNFNEEAFVKSALKFNRNSLLHIYVASSLYCYYSREFRKNGDLIEEDGIEWWTNLMKIYKVKLKHKDYDEDDEDFVWKWYTKNEEQLIDFFDVISDEVVHILFNDKHFLVLFNRLVRNVLIDEDGAYADYVKWPENSRNYDHIVPLKDYGTNDPCNLQLICEHCNKSKGAKDKVPNYKYQRWW